MNTFALRGTGLFEWILQTSWQAAVLAALILLTQWLFRKRLSPGWRYGLWFLLVARLLLPASPQSAFSLFNLTRAAQTAAVSRDEAEAAPLPQTSPEPLLGHDIPGAAAETTSGSPGQAGVAAIPSLNALTAQDGGAEYNAAATTGPAAAVTGKRIEWIPLAVVAWFAGVCFFALRLIGTNILFARRLRGHSAASARVREVLEQCQSAVDWRNPVLIIETGAVNTPAVWGLRRKVLLLPEGMADQFSDDELRHILLHELAHLKRRDLEVNWLVTVLQVLHWFNPVLWFAFRRMRADRELATDALALSCGRGRENIPYGETILKVLEGVGRGPVLPGLVGIAESKTQIKERLIAIATHGKFRPWNAAAVAALAIIGVLTLTDAKQAAPDSKAGATNSLADSSSTKQNIDGRKRFEMRVIEYETSRPVADTKVRFEFDYYSKPSRTEERLTGADGIAAIEFETADVSRFAYRVQKDGYLAPRGDWLKNQVALAPERFEPKISQGTEIGGKVTDENGKPVPGAEILFDRPINMIMSANDSDYPIVSRKWSVFGGDSVAVTDAAGQWRARCIYPTITMAPLRVRHPDFAEAPYSTETTKAMEAQGKGHAVQFDDLLQKRAVFKLSPGESVTGKVLDDAGAPVSRALVRYADRPSENPFWDDVMGKGTVTTDANGAFRIAHLPPKRIFFTVQMPGYAPTVKELEPGSAPREVELRLSKGRKLLGQVVDDRENRPISGARLKFNDWSIWQGVKWDAVTDSDGRFQWERAPAQKFQVHAEREGYVAQDKTLESNEEQVIRLKPVLKVSGEVVDASNRKPIERFRVCWGDRNDRIEELRRFALAGSNGFYSVDVGRLKSDLWSGGYAHDFVMRIEAEGYLAATSRVFSSRGGDVGDMGYDFALKPAEILGGVVVDATGKTVAGAQVAFTTPKSRLRLAGKPQFEKADTVAVRVTDQDGRFRITQDLNATNLVVAHERGVAWMAARDLGTGSTIKLQPWGRVEGTVWEYDRPVTNEAVWHSSALLEQGHFEFVRLQGTTDVQGHFAFDFVPPGKHRFYRMIPFGSEGRKGGGPAELVEVKPGETTRVKVGGMGRPVTGRMKVKNPYVEIEWKKDHHSVHAVLPRPPEGMTSEEMKSWRQREDIQRAYESIRHHTISFSEDGSFVIDEMLPGKYQFSIRIYDPREPDALAYSRYIASYNETFEVPDTEQRNSREPLDIGTFELSLKPQIEEGKTAAPAFTATNMEGKEFKLSDFKGKYVLLDFWATWCGPCIAELPYLREAHKKFSARKDFVMISLSMDNAIDKPREFIKKNDMPWLQGHLGEGSDVPGKYDVEGIPALFLINPEGKIIAKGMRGGDLVTQLERRLK